MPILDILIVLIFVSLQSKPLYLVVIINGDTQRKKTTLEIYTF